MKPVSYTHLDVYKRQVLLWKENMRLAEHEETSSDVGDLDDFIFSGEEWHISER